MARRKMHRFVVRNFLSNFEGHCLASQSPKTSLPNNASLRETRRNEPFSQFSALWPIGPPIENRKRKRPKNNRNTTSSADFGAQEDLQKGRARNCWTTFQHVRKPLIFPAFSPRRLASGPLSVSSSQTPCQQRVFDHFRSPSQPNRIYIYIHTYLYIDTVCNIALGWSSAHTFGKKWHFPLLKANISPQKSSRKRCEKRMFWLSINLFHFSQKRPKVLFLLVKQQKCGHSTSLTACMYLYIHISTYIYTHIYIYML